MTEVRRPFVIHPLLFAAYPIAFLYAHNVDAVRVATTLRPLALTVLVVGIRHAVSGILHLPPKQGPTRQIGQVHKILNI